MIFSPCLEEKRCPLDDLHQVLVKKAAHIPQPFADLGIGGALPSPPIVPERFWFFDRTTTTAANKWTVILDVDQSGSMGESVIYSSVMSCRSRAARLPPSSRSVIRKKRVFLGFSTNCWQ